LFHQNSTEIKDGKYLKEYRPSEAGISKQTLCKVLS